MCGSLIAGFVVLIAVAVSGNVNQGNSNIGNFTIDEEITELFCKNVLDLSDHLLEFYNEHAIRTASFNTLVRMCSDPVAPTGNELQDYLTSELDFDEYLAETGRNMPELCGTYESKYIELTKTDPKDWNRISYLAEDIVVAHLICSKDDAITNEDKAQLFRIDLQISTLGIWKIKKNSGLKETCYKVKIGKRFASIC